MGYTNAVKAKWLEESFVEGAATGKYRTPYGYNEAALPEELFDRLPNLQALTVYNAGLRTLAGIERLAGLTELSISGCASFDLDDAAPRLAQLPALTTLRIDGPSARSVPASFERLQGLLRLELYDLRPIDLDVLFRRLAKLQGLRSLVLQDRAKRPLTLPPSIGEMRQLRTLEIDAPVTSVTAEIGAMSSLETLALTPQSGRYVLPEIPETIGRLARLEVLHLHRHQLKAVPDSLCDLVDLRILGLSRNPLRALPERLGNLAKLERLDIAGCKIKELPASFVKLNALKTFDADESSLRALPAGFDPRTLEKCILPERLRA